MNDAYLWILIVAAFWIPPFFVASWLGDVKRTSEIERPSTWALLGWLGTLVFALRKPYAAKDPEVARQRSRIVVFMSLIALCGVAALVVYDSNRTSSSTSTSDVENTMLAAFRDPANKTDGYSVKSVACVHRSGGEYSCIATFYVTSTGRDASFSYITTCDSTRCIWRPAG